MTDVAPSRLTRALAALALSLTPLGSVRAWEPDAAAREVLASGQAWADVQPDGAGAAVIRAAVDIPRPATLVWRVMTDCRYASRLVSTVTSCKVLRASGDGVWDVREEVTRGGFLFPAIHNVFRSDYRPYSDIHFHRVAGDLAAEDGAWRLDPLPGGGGVRVTYINHIAAHLSVPAFLVRLGMKQSTPRVMMNLKRLSMSLPARQ